MTKQGGPYPVQRDEANERKNMFRLGESYYCSKMMTDRSPENIISNEILGVPLQENWKS